jgi:hypothetical protein
VIATVLQPTAEFAHRNPNRFPRHAPHVPTERPYREVRSRFGRIADPARLVAQFDVHLHVSGAGAEADEITQRAVPIFDADPAVDRRIGVRGDADVLSGDQRLEFVGALALGAMLSGLVTAGRVAAADGKKRVDQITCEEFLSLDPDDQQRIAYWVDGYEEAKGEAAIGTVAFDKFGNPIGALVDDCRVTPKETLWQKLKKHI